jgi:hypothetical protein
VLGFRSSRARLRLVSCPAAQPPTHLVLGFGSSCARLLSPHSSCAQLWLISCSASAHLMSGCSAPPHISCSASAHLVPGCSAPTHLVLSFGSSRARLRLISCPAAQPRSNNERLELCNSLSDEGDYSQSPRNISTSLTPRFLPSAGWNISGSY